MAVALDSDVLIAFLDRGDSLHDAADQRVRSLLDDGSNLCTSVVSYAEVLTGAKLGHHDEAVVRGFFDDLISWLTPVDRPVADRAAELRALRKALRMPDALILAGAELDPGVDLIICGDELPPKLGQALGCEVQRLRP